MTFKKQSSQLAASFCAIFVGDAGGELAERRRLLALDQPVLRGAQVLRAIGQLAGALVEQADITDRNRRLVGEGGRKLACLLEPAVQTEGKAAE